ncbi:MAG TPA: hypothetical protein PLB89_08450 [Flavobacteriales bacterium]|nr:hypothetical protein [Flavobacteriales bacterium]
MSALDKPTFEQIEAYVLDRLGADARLAFEQRMATDLALRAEVELERENILAIELGGMERMLKKVREEHSEQRGQGGSWTTWLKYAAVVAVVMAGALWFTLRPSANERVFAANYSPDPGLPVAMGATDPHAFNDAMVAFKLGDNDEAIGKFTTLLKDDPASDTLRYYIGCAELNAGRPERAAPMLMAVADLESSAFSSKARWYAFLALVRSGDRSAAEAVRFDGTDPNGAKAKAVLSELN